MACGKKLLAGYFILLLGESQALRLSKKSLLLAVRAVLTKCCGNRASREKAEERPKRTISRETAIDDLQTMASYGQQTEENGDTAIPAISCGMPHSVVTRSVLIPSFKRTRETGSVLIAHGVGDLLNTQVRARQQLRCSLQPFFRQSPTEGLARCLLEKMLKM